MCNKAIAILKDSLDEREKVENQLIADIQNIDFRLESATFDLDDTIKLVNKLVKDITEYRRQIKDKKEQLNKVREEQVEIVMAIKALKTLI